jgi:dCTP deaminase
MGWLTGKQVIEEVKSGCITIDPFNEDQVNPNSYDYRLAPLLRRLLPNSVRNFTPCIDPKLPMKYEEITIPEDGFMMIVEEAYLGHTVEQFGSKYFASLCTGKSSVGRLFIKNHACAGLIDQGFLGHITLEMTAKLPTIIYPGMRIGQLFWFESIGEIELYHGKYGAGNAALPSQIYKDLNK